ncbi:MAG: alpha-L-fucosidase [Eubacteriales bacterium]|nr:alpha-L-fucosidase [Eubacteriales bacterium]
MFDWTAYEERTRWFREARFGMFIHWGLYAIPARGEWLRSSERISAEAYEPLMHEFHPIHYEPKQWAKLCKQAGMKYAVMTAKHHDGFCLFDSALTDFKSTNTPCGRDLIREYVEAFRAEGLGVGLYYSLLDWRHPDYPAYGDRNHPLRDQPTADTPKDFNRYLEYMHGQVRELMTNYGKIDLLWLDFSYDDMMGEKWRATELTRMVRQLQPGILLNSRLESSGESYGSLLSDAPTETSGDFTCPEMIIPGEGLRTPSGRKIAWECCTTLNNSWGYTAADHEYKSSDMVVRKLVECVSKDGNLLINVGPDATGRIPEEQQQILTQVGQWLDRNGESIYGCGQAGLDKPDWGRYTQKGDTVYAHLLEQPLGPICLKGLRGRVSHPRRVADGAEAYVPDSWVTKPFPRDEFLSLDQGGVQTILFPKTPDFVLKFKLR